MKKQCASAEEILKRHFEREAKGYNYENAINTRGLQKDILKAALKAMEEYKFAYNSPSKENVEVTHVEIYYDKSLPTDNYVAFVAYVKGEKYKGMVVTADTLPDALKELSISLNISDIVNLQKEKSS